MTTIGILFLFGVVFLALEVVVPGMIMGLIAALVFFAGVMMAFYEFGMGGGAVAALTAFSLVGLTLYLEFHVIPKTRFARSLTLSAKTQAPAPLPHDLLDQVGVTATPLAPTGYVNLPERQIEATSISGFLPAGTAVRVTALDNFRVIVTKTNT
jgi:membrane-bound ClpP family serine protease